MRKLDITVGRTAHGGRVSKETLDWSALADRLTTFRKAPITHAAYRALSTDEKANLKNSFGFFIGGSFAGSTRKLAELKARSVLTLDLDYVDAFDVEYMHSVYMPYAHVAHTSMSHHTQKPKWRFVFPLTRDVTPDEYEPLARKVASWFDIDATDRVSYRPSQLMYYPASVSDVAPESVSNPKAVWLNPDTVLNEYDDWTDFGEWPIAERDGDARKAAKKMEDPATKSGVIGAFCREYDIHSAISKFDLPYAPTEHDNRYTPHGASGSQGAVIYDSEGIEAAFLYSHHSNDPAANKCLNAWDLVRICKFGDTDDSHKEMYLFAADLGFASHRAADVDPDDEFDELPDEPESDQGNVPPAPAGPSGAEASGADEFESDTPVSETAPGAKKSSRFSFAALTALVQALGPTSTHEERQQVLRSIAIGSVSPTEIAQLAAHLKGCYPIKMAAGAIIKEIEQVRKNLKKGKDDQTNRDIEQMLIDETLREHFAAGQHIRRIENNFWTYREGLWALENDERIGGLMTRTIIRLREERPKEMRILSAYIGDTKTSGCTAALRKMFSELEAAKVERDDPLHLKDTTRAPIVNCLNGELHFDDRGEMKFVKHQPENFHTVRIDTAYDVSAACPRWDRFCDHLFANSMDPEDNRRHLEEFLGYIIQSSRFLRTWALFHGPTGTGKSTIADVMKKLMGESVLERDLRVFDGAQRSPHAEMPLIGKLLVIDEDQAKGAILPDSALKKLSEGKTLTAERKFGGTINFVARATPLMLSNHWPTARDQSEALRDRALVFIFDNPYTYEERDDQTRYDMINDELPGILNRLLAGIGRLRQRGGWLVPDDCQRARDLWLSNSSPVNRFLDERTERGVASKLADYVKSAEVWNAYLAWCADNVPNRGARLGKGDFLRQLAELKLPRVSDGRGGFVIKGLIRLIDIEEDDTSRTVGAEDFD